MSSIRSQDKPRKRQNGRKSASSQAVDASWASASDAQFYLLVFVLFLAAGFSAYEPALDGEFISDDMHYVASNIYVNNPSLDSLMAILDPTGMPAKMVENYAPVHLILHAIEWQVFGKNVYGYHVVNVVVHVLASVLLLLAFRACGISRIAATFGAAFFLIHPANVEAVSWISQLKTTSALVLVLLALMVHFKRPAIGALLFASALFAKPTAAVGVFALVLGGWLRAADSGTKNSEEAPDPPAIPVLSHARWNWGWIAIWGGVLIVFAIAEFHAFGMTAGQAPVFYTELDVRLRTVCAVALRYLVMALSGWGVSTFHEPPAAASWLDSWWLASTFVLALLAWRTLWTLREKRVESIFWIWAIVSFAPICGVIPLPFPMADRYLYFMLPGLIGGFLIAGGEFWQKVSSRRGFPIPSEVARFLMIGLAVLWLGAFFVQTHKRAGIWKNGFTMMADAEKNYPEGLAAQTRIAKRAALVGDAEATVRALRAANARGYNRLDHIIADSGYDQVRMHPLFVELVRDIARDWLRRYEQIEEPEQAEYRLMAQAYVVLDDLDAAIRNIEAGLEIEGPHTKSLRDDLEGLKRKKRIRESTLD